MPPKSSAAPTKTTGNASAKAAPSKEGVSSKTAASNKAPSKGSTSSNKTPSKGTSSKTNTAASTSKAKGGTTMKRSEPRRASTTTKSGGDEDQSGPKHFTVERSNVKDEKGNMITGGTYTASEKQTPKDAARKAAKTLFKNAASPPNEVAFTLRQMMRKKPRDTKGKILEKPMFKYSAKKKQLPNGPTTVPIDGDESNGYIVEHYFDVKRVRDRVDNQ